MAHQIQAAINDILTQVLDEFGGRLSIDGGSSILTSDANVASAIATATKNVRTPYGPTITVASRENQGEIDVVKIEGGNVNISPVESLKMDHFTHAVFAINSDDPKFVLEGLKWMKYALQPKGVAIVISLKQETKQSGGEGSETSYTVALEDKIKFQSRGKAERLTDVLEYAGFERGKIRSYERSSEAGGRKVEAEVVLGMKWDQLTA